DSSHAGESLETAELFADGSVQLKEVQQMHESGGRIAANSSMPDAPHNPQQASHKPRQSAAFAAWWASHPVARDATRACLLSSVAEVAEALGKTGSVLTPRQFHVEVQRVELTYSAFFDDIFGNPFRPVAFDPRWRTSDSVGVAR